MNALRNPHLNGNTFFLQGTNNIGVLLIHGFTATTVEMSYIGKYLNDRGYTVSAPLLPGHGTTPEDMNKRKWQEWTGAVEAAYAQLKAKYEKVVIAGESMGAVLALHLISHHPEAVAVIGYAPALLINATPARLFGIRLMSLLKTSDPKPVRPHNITDDRTQSYSVNPLKAVLQLIDLQKETRPRLAHIAQPVLIIQGRLDVVIDPRNGEVILGEVKSKNKELHWLEKSTHVLILDQEWERAAELTLNFIQKATQ